MKTYISLFALSTPNYLEILNLIKVVIPSFNPDMRKAECNYDYTSIKKENSR